MYSCYYQPIQVDLFTHCSIAVLEGRYGVDDQQSDRSHHYYFRMITTNAIREVNYETEHERPGKRDDA